MNPLPLLMARSRWEFELMEDELGTVAVFIGYFHDADSHRAGVLEVLAHGGKPDGNCWNDPQRGTVYSLWQYE